MATQRLSTFFTKKKWGRCIFTQFDLVAHIFLVGVGEKPPTISSKKPRFENFCKWRFPGSKGPHWLEGSEIHPKKSQQITESSLFHLEGSPKTKVETGKSPKWMFFYIDDFRWNLGVLKQEKNTLIQLHLEIHPFMFFCYIQSRPPKTHGSVVSEFSGEAAATGLSLGSAVTPRSSQGVGKLGRGVWVVATQRFCHVLTPNLGEMIQIDEKICLRWVGSITN